MFWYVTFCVFLFGSAKIFFIAFGWKGLGWSESYGIIHQTFERYGPPKTLCPHLLALRVGKYVQLSVEDLIILLIDPFSNYVIELWVEKKRLIGNLDLAEGIAAFFHLVFVFNLEYPVVN